MAGKPKHRYSVYEAGTDRPICIYGTARDCAEALGIEVKSFWHQIMRVRKGETLRRYQIFKDDNIDIEEE
jgi:hypothetical protein